MLVVICVVLMITVLLQYRYNTELKKELKEISLSDKIKSGIKAANFSSGMSNTPEKNNNDAGKIKRLESKITDMQAWQDYLEESLQKYQSEEDKKETVLYRQLMNGIPSYYNDFAEENNLPVDIKNELFNLLIEKGIEERGLWPGDPALEAVTQKYDELISELLADKYPAYVEYLELSNERYEVREFRKNIMTLDDRLDKQQEKRLIASMYNDKRDFLDKHNEEIQKLNDENNFKNLDIMKEGIELEKKLHNRFLNSAGNILSQSQLKEFQKYLDTKISEREADFKKYEDVSRLQEELDNRDGS